MDPNQHKDAAATTTAAKTHHHHRRRSNSSSSRSDLHTTKQLFDLVHHRNKNQHRHSVWWRHFAALRRAVGKLVQEVDDESKGDGEGEGEGGSNVSARARFLDGRLIPKCYLYVSLLFFCGDVFRIRKGEAHCVLYCDQLSHTFSPKQSRKKLSITALAQSERGRLRE